MGSLLDDDFIKKGEEALEDSQNGPKDLKIVEGETPIYIMSNKAENGFEHFVESQELGKNGKFKKIRTVCPGGIAGKGNDTANCEICSDVMERYKKGKALRDESAMMPKGAPADSKYAIGDKIKKSANQDRASYGMTTIGAKGSFIREKNEKGDKVLTPEFDFTPTDGSEPAEIGFLKFSEAQWKSFKALVGDPLYPFIKTTSDLLNRVIIWVKKREGDKMYATTTFRPLENKSDKPSIEFNPDDYDVDSKWKIDEEQYKKAVAAVRGESVVSSNEDDFEFEKLADEPKEDNLSDIADEFNSELDGGFVDDNPEDDKK